MKEGKRLEVAEFQGFYGPFTVTEKLLQKIWLRGDFDAAAARTLDGETVDIRFPGKWNLLEGPDFRNARLRIGGREVTGDVELHFHAVDWVKHGHHRDPGYDQVVLHVLLFQPKPGEGPAVTASGRVLPALSLLEILHHDLEEYAAEDALEATLERNHWQATEELVALPMEERRELLGRHSRSRWEQKKHFARLRIDKLGWEEACHQTALEILGYRRNRGPMINAATRYPLTTWAAEKPTEEELLATAHWVRRGARPANHPRQRLRQYCRWVAARPDWPSRLVQTFSGGGGSFGDDGNEWLATFATRSFRTENGLRKRREEWADSITGGAVGGTRLDTLFCDGFFPLAAVAERERDLFPYWFFWYAGDFPDRVIGTIRTAAIADGLGFANCNGFCQGVLSLSLEKRSDPLVCF